MFIDIKNSKTKDPNYFFVLLFFIAYFIIGVVIVKDYGVSTDEIYQIDKAKLNWDYILGKNQDLLAYEDRHYGAIFPTILMAGDYFLSDSRDIFIYRHFVTFLFYFIGSIWFYKLLREFGTEVKLSLLGTLFYIIHPHIFAHSFYNPKDIPFLVIWVLTLLLLIRFIKKTTIGRTVLLAISTGILIVFRLPGILIIPAVIFLVFWSYRTKHIAFVDIGKTLLLFSVVMGTTLFLLMPTLWHDPVNEFISFIFMKPFEWNSKELFIGSFYRQSELPWYYLPVYMIVTTPVLLISFSIFGYVVDCYIIISSLFSLDSKTLSIMRLFIFTVPFLAIIIADPVIYNGWRHAFFLYPMMVLFCIKALDFILNKIKYSSIKAIVLISTGIQIIVIIIFLIQSHPYQFSYYNFLGGRNLILARNNFAMDYWGLSYSESLRKIADRDRDSTIIVRAENYISARQNLMMLPKEDRDRIKILGLNPETQEDYFITSFREYLPIERKKYILIDSISIRGALINATYIPKNK